MPPSPALSISSSVPRLAWIVAALACGHGRPAVAAQPYSLVIGVDGLGPYGLEAAQTPSIDSLASGGWAGGYRGSITLDGSAGGVLGTASQQVTLSGPGWSSILTGVWVDRHGVTNNSFAGRRYDQWPSYLKVLEASLPAVQTAGIVSWTPLDTYVFADDGVNPAIDVRQATNDNDEGTTSAAVSWISGRAAGSPAAAFVHLDDVDIAGHGSGLYSNAYLTQVADVDSQIGAMLQAIRSRPTFASEDWQVIVVSDHGHRPAGGHGGQTQLERTIPIVVSSRTTVAGVMPITATGPSQVDVAATVLDHFGVARPAGLAGTPLGRTAAPTAAPASLANRLVSHIGFDGTTSGAAGTVGGTPAGAVAYVPGRFGQAATVATYGAGLVRLDADFAARVGTQTDFAMSIWIAYDSFTGDPAILSNKNWVSGANVGINLALQSSNGPTLDFNTTAATSPTGTLRRDIEPYRGLPAQRWHHVVFNVDRDGETLLYVNGALFGEITQTAAGSFDGAFNWTFFNDGTGAYAGGSASGLRLDEFAAWDRLLTPDEIAYLAAGPVSVPEPSSLAAWGVVGLAIVGLRWRRSHESRTLHPCTRDPSDGRAGRCRRWASVPGGSAAGPGAGPTTRSRWRRSTRLSTTASPSSTRPTSTATAAPSSSSAGSAASGRSPLWWPPRRAAGSRPTSPPATRQRTSPPSWTAALRISASSGSTSCSSTARRRRSTTARRCLPPSTISRRPARSRSTA